MKITHIPNTSGVYPLSSSQSRIWFMENLDHNITAYNIPLDYRITGNLDVPTLNKSLNFLIDRHPSFRTVFPDGDGNPVQKILPKINYSIRVTHLENEPKETLDNLISELSCANSLRKFDMQKGPMFHFELLRINDQEHILLINFHHMISDATSVAIFLDELSQVYSALKENRPVELPAIEVTYADYALWEEKWVKSDEYRQQMDYWKQELRGIPELLQLPLDHPRPRMQTYQGNEYHFEISSELREKLAAISKKHSTSLFVTMLAAYGILLSRYSNQEDIVIGVPVANRTRAELESMIGILINSIPVRLVFDSTTTFSDAIELTKKKFLNAYDNQEVAFEKLVDELKLKRNTSASPVFQVLFNFLTTYQKIMKLSDVTLQMLDGERRAAQVDITLSIHDQKQDMHGIVEYNTDLFDRETISRFAEHYKILLSELADQEQVNFKKVPIITQEEEELMFGKWNETYHDYPRTKCVHDVFEEQVLKTPDSIAVADDNGTLTYSELNSRSNQLARYLGKQGVKEGSYVAVFLERSKDFVVSMLAVTKSGATSVPLDPIFPKDRLTVILQEANPPVIITQKSLLESVPDIGAKILFVDDKDQFANESDINLGLGNPDDAAYMLFTSGSTGKPKGVMVKQNSTVNIVYAIGRRLNVKPEDVILASATATFDVAEMEIYLPLFHGASTYFASQESIINTEEFKKKIEEVNATLLLATPVTFKMLVMSNWAGKKDARILIGGEGLAKELAAELLTKVAQVWNGYAPTETTVYSLARKVIPEDTNGEGYVTLGHALDNNTMYILNTERVPVPIGVPGELYIGGEGVSKGYLNRPEMNRDMFLPDPYIKKPGSLMYKTGDLVCYSPDGKINFLNRVDFQVKIRGFRIELGEIESNIARFGNIKENVVVVRNDPSGEKMLVAYYVPEEGQTINLQDLKTFLKSKMPEYMVPAAYMQLEKFPLTSTLKVDRKALPEPEAMTVHGDEDYVEPSTQTEKKIAKIWQELLNLKKVGIHDDFFEVGGHSMIAVSLMVKIEKEVGIRLPLSTLFERSTIAGLAELIDNSPEAVKWRSLVPIRPKGSKKPLFLVHGMGLNVLLYTTVVNYLDPEQPVYGLQAKGLNGEEEPLDTIEDIAAYYISEIFTIDPEGPYAMAGFSLGGRIAYEIARQLDMMGKKVSFLGVFDATADENFNGLPAPKKYLKKIVHGCNYTLWNIGSFFSGKDDTLSVVKRKWKGLEKKINGNDFKIAADEQVSLGKRKELPKYMRKVHKANHKADKNYIIRSYPGAVHLFKAEKQTFYLVNPDTYGWDRVAAGGVHVHVIPGEHSNTFAPPNDKFFASVLQKSLNDCNSKYSEK